MNGQSFYDYLLTILKKDSRFLDEDGDIIRNAVIDKALKYDDELLASLLVDKKLKEVFFKDVNGSTVFLQNLFIDYIQDKNFLIDSYTKYKNKIGLTIDGKYLKERNEVSLVWPFKDGVLEGGQTKEEQKRKEIFFNEILAKDEVDRLEEPKVLTNFRRYTKDGEEKIEEIEKDEDGTIRDNLIIKGNNLLALHSLKKIYSGKVKLIYIDPPYYFKEQKSDDSFSYNTNFKLSTWLTFMRNRLKVAKNFLDDEGTIFVQISDDGTGHLKLLLDELFKENNFINIISVKMKNIAGASGGGEDKRLKKNIEFIYVYAKDYDRFAGFKNVYDYTEIYELVEEYKQSGISWKYTSVLFDSGDKQYIKSTVDGRGDEIKIFKRVNPKFTSIAQLSREEGLSEKRIYYKYMDKIFTTALPQSSIRKRVLEVVDTISSNDELYSIEYVPKSGRNKGVIYEQFYKGANLRLITWLKDVIEEKDGVYYKKDLQGTYWDGFNLNNLSKEGDVDFDNGKKPEALLQRIIDMSTSEGDIVMDFHMGSGTTCAVAHKMKRKYIGVEQLDYGEEDSIKRLIKVLGGDTSGVSEQVNWRGGGTFIYCELKKFNEEFIDRIQIAESTKELLNIWEEMKDKSFLNYNVDIKKQEQEIDEFKALSLEKQKKALIELLDKNMLYVPLSDIDDEDFKISEEDKKLNKQFYG